jgi:hypothetical protein
MSIAKHPTFLDITQENLQTLALARDMFGTKSGEDWPKAVSRFNDKAVGDFFEHIKKAWLNNSTPKSALPTHDASVLRLSYIADHPGTKRKLDDITRVGLYADEILLLDPFPNPDDVLNVGPASYGFDLFHRISFLEQLRPMIEAGIVCFVPDPGDIDPGIKGQETLRPSEVQSANDFREQLEQVEVFLQEHPEIASQFAELQATIAEYRRSEGEALETFLADLLGPRPWYDGESEDSSTGSELTVQWLKGDVEVPTIRYVAEVSGAVPYAVDSRLSRSPAESASPVSLDPYATALAEIELPALKNVSPTNVVRLKAKGRLGGLKDEIKDIFKEAEGTPLSDLPKLTPIFQDRLLGKINKSKADWYAIDRDLFTWAGTAGAASAGAVIVAGVAISASSIAFLLAAGVTLAASQMKRREFRLKNPLTSLILLDLKATK